MDVNIFVDMSTFGGWVKLERNVTFSAESLQKERFQIFPLKKECFLWNDESENNDRKGSSKFLEFQGKVPQIFQNSKEMLSWCLGSGMDCALDLSLAY